MSIVNYQLSIVLNFRFDLQRSQGLLDFYGGRVADGHSLDEVGVDLLVVDSRQLLGTNPQDTELAQVHVVAVEHVQARRVDSGI